MFYHVKVVESLRDINLRDTFFSGDVKPLLKVWQSVRTLAQVRGLLEQVCVDLGGNGISWNDDIDISCDEPWENGVPLNVEECMTN